MPTPHIPRVTAFGDGAHVWHPELTRTAERAARAPGPYAVDAGELAALDPARAIERFAADVGALGRLLWCACEAEAEARGLTPEEFAARATADDVFEAAVLALLNAIARRYPRSRLAHGLRAAGAAR